MPNSYRIRTQVGVDKYINVNLDQDFEFLEILSLKILTTDLYTRFCSDYGVVVGRVLVNGGFGVPNARVSVFLPLEEGDLLNPVIRDLYPYQNLSDRNLEGYRYNLLPSAPSYSTHTNTGTFPTREDALLNQSWIEVYDKYYRFTVKTNESGDFMIFGVPTGDQTLVMDVDLSDIGCFSLNPQDLIIQGVATTEQVNGSKFKSSTNLDELPQIQNLNFNVDVRPLWGDEDQCQIGITRVDFDLTKLANIKIQPSAVFMGSIMSTTDDDSVGASFTPFNSVTGPFFTSDCKPKNNTGNLCDLITGPGQILAVRQTIFADPNGYPQLETFSFADDGKIIDDNGAFVVNVPMNLDFLSTDEFGNQVISNNPNIGIPTKGKYRFKFKWINEQGLSNSIMRGNYLIPNVKEHGWTLGSSIDPFNTFQPVNVNLQIPAGQLSGSYIFTQNGGITNITTINIDSYVLLINGNPYYGTLNSIPLSTNDTFTFDVTPIDSSQQTEINFVFYILPLFDLFRSYAFSLDWDDYGDTTVIQEAINCEDKFYEFNYNKVYTPAMFVDRYKKGLGRAKHLGIKEIDDRTCKTTTNTYPVNDIIRNFDFLFFAFNILLNILTPVFIFVLFTAHLAFWIIEKINEDSPLLIRFSLPMISYPECTACDCSCNTEGLPIIVTDGSGIFEPLNASENYNTSITPYFSTTYRNAVNALNPPDNLAFGSYWCPGFDIGGEPYMSSIQALNLNGVISNDIVTRTTRDFYKMFSGYDYEASETDNISLIDTNFSPLGDILLKRAPQVFLWSALEVNLGEDKRYWAFPNSVPLTQRLNEFNLRDKYFSTTALNRVTTTVNPDLGSDSFQDQLLVMFAKPGTLQNMGIGQVLTFQDPNLSGGKNLLTGATLNQFSTSSVTGVTTLGQQTKIINYADPSNFSSTTSLVANIEIIQSSKYGNTMATQEDDYLRYPTDLEYFQVVTGLTYAQFSTVADFTTNGFPKDFLGQKLTYIHPECLTFNTSNSSVMSTYTTKTLPLSNVEYLLQKDDYEVIFLTRGVDPNTDKQTIKYDLSLLFGNPALTNVIEGSYYLNYPIQTYPQFPTKPRTHVVSNNTNGLYFPSFTFTITPSNYTAFTSTMPYYYLCTDEFTQYVPYAVNFTVPSTSTLSTNGLYLNNNGYTLPRNSTAYIGGGSFISSTNNTNYDMLQQTDTSSSNQPNQYFGNDSANNDYFYKTFFLYSPAYINYHNSYVATGTQGPIANKVNFSNSNRILMRSDRLPTSTIIENVNSNSSIGGTAFALHQNTSFTFYKLEELAGVTNITISGFDALNYTEDENTVVSGLTQTLDCDGMVSLQCYTGSGQNIGVNPNCIVPSDRVVNGCYCLLNKNSNGGYLVDGAFKADLQLLLEWKARFTLTFAACRGVFAQTFQNNWVNGNLYMFSFLKKTTFDFAGNASYRYCKDVAVYNPFSNSFFYRSSPYDDTDGLFVGKESPTQTFSNFNYGYNDKNIQFPTTITDLGPRDVFIREICCNSDFGAYYADQLKSTSYQDNSDIIQLGFLSRILDNTTIGSLLPNGDQEGLGVNQFFDNTRGGDRIDGDWAQMLSINSEWKIIPFNIDNVDSSQQVFIGKSLSTSSNSKPVFGVFFNRSEDSLRYRKIMSPGIETYSFSPVLIEENFGYPKSQTVPFYKWKVEQPANIIFGTENNNWWTTPNQVSNSGFYTKKYQSLDFVTPNEKYITTTTNLGYLTNYDINGNPIATSSNVVDGEPGGNPVIVGAPYHFYFGLYNGKTALDIFYKRYVQVGD